MKVKQEDYEHIGDRFTRGLGIGCAFSVPLAVVLGGLMLWWLA